MATTLLSKEAQAYFTNSFNELQKNGTISFDTLKQLCYECKEMDNVILNEVFKDIKTTLDKKNTGQVINLKQEEYFNYINQIMKEQSQKKNEKDPEMERLFQSLANKEGDYIYKKKLRDIITMFDLPLDIEEFFKPVQSIDQINFVEFCSLFKADNMDDIARKTFYSVIETSHKEPEEKEDIKQIYKANFPIKYYGY